MNTNKLVMGCVEYISRKRIKQINTDTTINMSSNQFDMAISYISDISSLAGKELIKSNKFDIFRITIDGEKFYMKRSIIPDKDLNDELANGSSHYPINMVKQLTEDEIYIKSEESSRGFAGWGDLPQNYHVIN